jgi:glycosyltransferase involved in cell wall biosynthesis
MRILFVNHTFPPESVAGSELCVLNTAKTLQTLNHQVAVFYRYSNPNDDEYQLRESTYDNIKTYSINHTYRFVDRFQKIYLQSAIAARFSYVLHRWKPDIVHFHHLTNLSLSLVQEAKAAGCKTVFTLHDYWLLCQRGQLLQRNLSLCTGPSLENCRSCLAPQLLKGKIHRSFSIAQHWLHQYLQSSDPFSLQQAKITTPDSSFVGYTRFGLNDNNNDCILAHPPSEIEYTISLNRSATLSTAIAMHPSMYDQPGKGVIFEIELNKKIVFSKCLNPKIHNSDHGWIPVDLDLKTDTPTKNSLIFRTKSESDSDNHFCTAGWQQPKLEEHRPVLQKSLINPRISFVRENIVKIIDWGLETITAFSPSANDGITHRRSWVTKTFNDIDVFISPSNFLREFFIHHGLPSSKIHFLDNGFSQWEKPVRTNATKPIRFGYIGTWIPPKGIHLLVKAFQQIDPKEAIVSIHGFFPGYDGHPDYMKDLQAMSSPAIQWKGKYSHSDVHNLLTEIDCLIVPSIWYENSPLTMHEAFLARVPILTADTGGMAEMVQEGGGLTFHHRDAEHLQYIIQQIISKPSIIDELRATIPKVQSIQDHVDRLLHIYSDESITATQANGLHEA